MRHGSEWERLHKRTQMYTVEAGPFSLQPFKVL